MPYEFRALFTPVRVGSVTLRNRIYSSGHAEAMAEGGRPTARLARYHEAKAQGGCALTIFGGAPSGPPASPAAAWEQIAHPHRPVISPHPPDAHPGQRPQLPRLPPPAALRPRGPSGSL